MGTSKETSGSEREEEAMLKTKIRVPDVASDGLGGASTFIDQVLHDKKLRRQLQAATKASTAARRRVLRRSRRQGIASLATDPVLRAQLVDALSHLQAVRRRARKRREHGVRNLAVIFASGATMIAATPWLRHALVEKLTREPDSA